MPATENSSNRGGRTQGLDPRLEHRAAVGRIVLIYALFAGLWIAVSDRLLILAVSDPETIGRLATVKGWFFVVITSILLYSLLRMDRARLQQAMQALHENNEQLRWLEDNIPGSYVYQYIHGPDGRPAFLYVSAGLEALHQLNRTDVLRDAGSLHRQIDPEMLTALQAAEKESLRTMKDFDQELKLVRPDGEVRWVNLRSRPRLRPDGPVVWDGVATDVTSQRRAGEASRESEMRLRSLVMLLPDALFINQDNRVVFANQRALRLWGAENEAQVLGRSPLDFFPPDQHERVRARIAWLMAEGPVAPIWETRVVALDGSVMPVEASAARFNLNGRPALQVVIRDISERKRAESSLQASEERLRMVTENARVGLVTFSRDRRYVYANQAYAEIVGRPLAEIIGHRIQDVLAEMYGKAMASALDRAFAGERAQTEVVRQQADGDRYYAITVEPLQREGGVEFVVAVILDITERRLAENSLRLFRCHVDQSLDGFEVVDLATGRFMDVNQSELDMLGYTRDEMLRLSVWDIDPQVTPEKWHEHHEKMMTVGRGRGEGMHRRKDGSVIPVEYHTRRVDLPQPCFVAAIRDITERKDAERILKEKAEQLHAADRRLAEIVHGMSEACIALDREWRFTFVNDRSETLFRCRRADVIGRSIWEVFPQLVGAPAEKQYRHAMAERVPLCYEVFSPVAERWIETRLFPTPDGLAAFMVDITDRRVAVGKLQESESRFRQVVESIQEVFWMTDITKQRLIYLSPGFETLWGRSCESVYASMTAWSESIHPEDRARVLDAARNRQAEGTYQETYRILRPDGTLRWVRDRAFPVKDADGQVRRVVGVAEDITEKRELEARFLRSQRMEAIGTLAGGVAHDLNNILAPVLMISGLLRWRLPAEEDRKYLDMLDSSARRGAGVIRQLLTFSRGSGGEKVIVQLQHLLKEVAALMRETLPRNITIRERHDPKLWPVSGDPTQFHQILMNLCVNARDAMPDGGILDLDAANLSLGEAEVRAHVGARPGRHVVITVTDTGLGMPPEILSRIFDPFFTTKEVGKGTGMGLATVLNLTKSHGGFVTVESEPGRGTTFRIHLPATIDELAKVKLPTDGDKPNGRGELILVVDDEPNICLATQNLLEAHHYRVITASNGHEALLSFVEHQARVRLVLTDSMMPEMGGTALIQSLRTIQPTLRIVATTGLEQVNQRAEYERLGVTEILLKPCSPEVLLRVIRRLLDA